MAVNDSFRFSSRNYDEVLLVLRQKNKETTITLTPAHLRDITQHNSAREGVLSLSFTTNSLKTEIKPWMNKEPLREIAKTVMIQEAKGNTHYSIDDSLQELGYHILAPAGTDDYVFYHEALKYIYDLINAAEISVSFIEPEDVYSEKIIPPGGYGDF